MNIFGWFTSDHENEIYDLLQDHADAVQATVNHFQTLVECFMDGEDVEELSLDVDDAEHNADQAKHAIEERLYEGMFLPHMREDYIQLAQRIDDVADRAETCSDMIGQQRPDIPEELHSEFENLTETVFRAFGPVTNNLHALKRRDRQAIRNVAQEVRRIEAKTDDIEWSLIRTIWDGDLSKAEKIHLRELVRLIASIADKAEDVANQLNNIAIKQVS